MSKVARIAVVVLAVSLAAAPAYAQNKGKAKRAKAAKPAKALKVDVAKERASLLGADAKAAGEAAARLGQSRQAGAFDALMDALAMGVAPSVAVAALTALGQHADARAFDVVSHYTGYRDVRVRAAAVSAVGALDDSRAVGLVLAALTDGDATVRGAAADVVAARKIKRGVPPMLKLLEKGDESVAPAIAALANPDLAKNVGELIGVAPNDMLARCLGLILLSPTFEPEAARVEVVRTIGKIPGNEALEQLTTYVATIPENPPRQSRREAEAIVEARLTGGD